MPIAETAAIGLFGLALLPATRAIEVVSPDFNCQPATLDDFNGMPGLGTFISDIMQDFGRAPKSDSWTINGTNESSVRGDRSVNDYAQICVSSKPFDLDPDWGTLSCYTSMVDYTAEYDATTGYIAASLSQGYSVTYDFQVSNTSSIGHSSTVMVSVQGGGEATGSVSRTYMTTTSLEFTNMISNTTSTTISTTATLLANTNAAPGENCTIHMNSTTCSLQASLGVPIIFDGWVGFSFDKEVTYTGQGKDSRHKGWQANPAISYGMPLSLTSSNVTLVGSITSQSNSDAIASCVNSSNPAAPPVNKPVTLTPLKKDSTKPSVGERAKRSTLLR